MRSGDEFGRQMAIAEVPGETEQGRGLGGGDLGKGLEGGADENDTAILQHQAVAVAERYCLGQVEQELDPALGGHEKPSSMAGVVIEGDGIDRGVRPGRLCQDSGGADHGN